CTIPGLKVNLRSDLNLSRAAGQRVANPPEQRAGDVRSRRVKRRRVGQIRRIGADLQLHRLVDRDALQQRRIQLEIMWPDKKVAPRIAELPGAGSGKLGALRL